MKDKYKVTKVVVALAETKVEMTVEDARKLWLSLGELFDHPVQVYPVYPNVQPIPPFWRTPWYEVTCSTGRLLSQ